MANAIPVHSKEPQEVPADAPQKAPEIVGELPEGFDMVGVMNAQKVVFRPDGGYSVYW